MIRLGLCCIFKNEPIKFRTTTASVVSRLSQTDAIEKLTSIIRDNSASLLAALKYCKKNQIGSFRVNSRILPLATHPDYGYSLKNLPDGESLINQFQDCGNYAAENNIRTTFHPDQFVVLNSPRHDVVASSIKEIEYQTEVAQWINADVINIHCGGGYGDKVQALSRLKSNVTRLSSEARKRLTFENDDKLYSPADVLSVCNDCLIPFVYDVHHHRCHTDNFDIESATKAAISTWNREPLFHISSPLNGWNGTAPSSHHDFIDVNDFPEIWTTLDITIEVEAKAKELAVKKLRKLLA